MPDPVLDYAMKLEANQEPPPIDITVVLLSVLQFLVTAFFAQGYLLNSRGYDELQNPSWHERVSWWLLEIGVQAAWCCVASVIAFVGAIVVPPARRRFFVISAVMVLALLLLTPFSLLAVDDLKYRWVSTYYGNPEPQSWRIMVSESDFYWQIPVMILICNPVLLLLTSRLLFRGRLS